MIASSQDSVTRNACQPAPRPLLSPGGGFGFVAFFGTAFGPRIVTVTVA